MNDAWDPVEDLEPLDDSSLGLLAAFRDASGPSEDAQARMLAGLRSRLAAESNIDDPVDAVSPETASAPREQSDASKARTFAIAAVAFAAGVALTVSLGRPGAPEDPRSVSTADAEHVARQGPPGAPARVRPEALVPNGGSAPTDLSVPGGAEPAVEGAWPLSIADLAKPAAIEEVEPMQGSGPLSVEPASPNELGEGTPAAPPRQDADEGAHDSDPMEGATASRRPLGPSTDPTQAGRGTPIPGAWAPSVSGASVGAGIGSTARNPAVAGASPTAPNTGSGSSSNAGGDSPSEEPPPPEPEDEPENEPEDERPPEEVCTEEFDACIADANIFCDSDYPGCNTAYEFCGMRSYLCLGGDSGFPEPPYPPDEPDPDDPDPNDCEMDNELCMLEVDSLCMLEDLPFDECDHLVLLCDEEMMMCFDEPPPEPW